ncbi:MAG: hypothetical protein H6559_34250 [Lewinellaceae bacterium]|nr:hypothetical protein [Lewinellaceae bacterium]
MDKSGGEYDGNLYAVWTADGFQAEATPGLDVYYSYSKDGGYLIWSDPIVLNNDGNPGAEQFFPSLPSTKRHPGCELVRPPGRPRQPPDQVLHDLLQGRILTFEDDFPVSSQGADFSMIGAANADFGVGEYTQILATDGYAIPVWW